MIDEERVRAVVEALKDIGPASSKELRIELGFEYSVPEIAGTCKSDLTPIERVGVTRENKNAKRYAEWDVKGKGKATV